MSLEEIRKGLTKKQGEKFKEMMNEYKNLDKIDIIFMIAKKRLWRVFLEQ